MGVVFVSTSLNFSFIVNNSHIDSIYVLCISLTHASSSRTLPKQQDIAAQVICWLITLGLHPLFYLQSCSLVSILKEQKTCRSKIISNELKKEEYAAF